MKTNPPSHFPEGHNCSRFEDNQPQKPAVSLSRLILAVPAKLYRSQYLLFRRPALTILVVGSALLSAGCGRADIPNILDAQGPGAAQIERLWWLMFWLGLAVLLLTLALVTYAVFRDRRPPTTAGQSATGEYLPDARTDPRTERLGERMIVYGGIIFPVPILAIVLGYTLFSANLVTQPGSAPPPGATSYLTVDIIGHQFWWEVRYPDHGVLTANEIHIPSGQPIFIRLMSQDVIHSFWVPQLHGKLDLVPGEVNTMWIEADQPGVYRGICAEFCGIQHAHMHFLVIAQPADEFAAWIEHQQQPAPEPADPLIRHGQQVFMGAACVYCHTVDGLTEHTPEGMLGPDLTHVASRQTLAAGMLENNRGNLGSWIVDPQGIKPGNRMPPTRLNSEDFLALLAYLESLR